MDFDEIFEGSEDPLYKEKIAELKNKISELLYNSREIRNILSELSTDEIAPILLIEVGIGFNNKAEERSKLEHKFAELMKEKEIKFNKNDREFLNSLNIELREDVE